MRKSSRVCWVPAVVCGAVLVAAGAGHRFLLSQIDAALAEPLKLQKPLSSLPLKLGPWAGRDIPLDAETRRIAGEDDFLNREYRSDELDCSVGLYVGYMGRPRSRMGHRPDTCYVAHGYEQVSQEPTVIAGSDNREIPALLYEFRSPRIAAPGQLVLVLYSINGAYINSTALADDYNTRGAGLAGKRTSYAARIQIAMQASGDRDRDVSILAEFGSRVVRPLAEMMPDAGWE